MVVQEDWLRPLFAQSRVSFAEEANVAEFTSFVEQSMRLQIRRVVGAVGMGSMLDWTGVGGFSDVDHGVVFQLARHEDSRLVLRRLRQALVEAVPWAHSVRVDTPGVSVQVGPERTQRVEFIPLDSTSPGYRGTTPMRHLLNWRGYLPDGRGGWMPTAPPAYAAEVDRCDKDHAVPQTAGAVRTVDDNGRILSETVGDDRGTVRMSIRLLKVWKYLNDVPILSLYLALLVCRIADRQAEAMPVSVTLREALRVMDETELAPLHDPVIEGNEIDPCDDRRRGQALQEVRTARILLDEVLVLEARDAGPDAVERASRRLFGGGFDTRVRAAPFPAYRIYPRSDDEFSSWFDTRNRALTYLEYFRWSWRRVTCPVCGSTVNVTRRHLWRCPLCQRSFRVLDGTGWAAHADPRDVLHELWDETRDAEGLERGRAFVDKVRQGVQTDG